MKALQAEIIPTTLEAATALRELEALPGVVVLAGPSTDAGPRRFTSIHDDRAYSDDVWRVFVPADPPAAQLRWAIRVIQSEDADPNAARPAARVSNAAGTDQPLGLEALLALMRLQSAGVRVHIDPVYGSMAAVGENLDMRLACFGPDLSAMQSRWIKGVLFQGKSADMLLGDDGAYFPRPGYSFTLADLLALGDARLRGPDETLRTRILGWLDEGDDMLRDWLGRFPVFLDLRARFAPQPLEGTPAEQDARCALLCREVGLSADEQAPAEAMSYATSAESTRRTAPSVRMAPALSVAP